MNDRGRLLELKREREWRRCAKNPVYFFTHYWFIAHPSKGRILFDMWPAQKRGLRHWMTNRYSLTLKARQLGWSTLAAGFAFWLAFFHPDKAIIMISRTERESIKLLKKSKYGYKHLPDWMKTRGPSPLVDHQQKMEFSNGSEITSLPSASDPARGESASLIIVDEWAFLPNAEDAWASIEPVADVGGQIIGLSTARGWGEFFHTLWVGAEAGTNQFKAFFVPWHGNAERDEAWYEAKKRSMLPWQLAQEYPDNADEAFVKSGRSVFDIEDLKAKVKPTAPTRGYLEALRDNLDTPEWHPNHSALAEDPLRLWVPPAPRGVYCIGADIAEGLEWGDFSSAHVIDATSGDVVAHWHGHIPADQFGEMLYMLGLWYNTALIGPESNNHGLTTITTLRRLGYRRIFRRRRLNTAAGYAPSMEFGWATNKATKPLMIDELARDLRSQEVHLYDAETLAELRTYVRDDQGRMGGSPHDDRVISLALANQMRQYVHLPEYRDVVETRYTMDWWDDVPKEFIDAKVEMASENVIGSHAVRR